MKERPIGVMILAVLIAVNGLLTIVGSWLIGDMIGLGIGVLALVLSVGLWFLQGWAWVGALLLQLYSIGDMLYVWFTGGPVDYPTLITGGIIIVYLLIIRKVFLRRPAAA